MTTQEIIKEICREHGITVSALEKKMNYGNGALTKAAQISFNRVVEIAHYFNVPIDYFIDEDGVFHVETDDSSTEKHLQKLRALEYYNRYLQAPQRIRDAVDMLLTEDQHTMEKR